MALVFLGVAAYALEHVISRVWLRGRLDEGALALAVPALLIGLACAWFAVVRALRGYDSAFEIDPHQRFVLIHTGSEQTATAIPFHAIRAIAVTRGDTRWVRGGAPTGAHRVSASVVLLPMNKPLISFAGETAFTRDFVVSQATQVGRQVAGTIGVPIVG
ncbi:Hypothetical protein A7982_01828 [Minicystis rosea]|nr:Hypothetical protein A7982_01828 [Minicystis rosea]